MKEPETFAMSRCFINDPPKPSPMPATEHTCHYCLHTGTDVIPTEYYDRISKRDTFGYQCKDVNACLDRCGWYPRKE
jgi:hypothetical protein